MKKIIIYIFLLILISTNGKTQNLPKDTIYGAVKKISEKVIFLTEYENPQLLYYDDYGHSGFTGPNSTITRFHKTWYTSNLCYYLNYEKFFDSNKKVIRENWFGKKGNLINSYRYIYDKKLRLISTIDSTDYSTSTRNHYFNDYGEYVEENIIFENSTISNFSHTYKKYKNGKVIRIKNFKKNGVIDEYINEYNKAGKLTYTIYKNPNKWKKLEGKSYSYGVQDSTIIVYKSLINEFDKNGRLNKTRTFDLEEKNFSNDIIESGQTTNIFDGDNLISSCSINKKGNETRYYYEYNNLRQLISKYCCSKEIANSQIIQKYKYDHNLITELLYDEGPFPPDEMKRYVVSYNYKFDDNKNWIEIIKTVDGIKRYKWTREIEYY